jgi:hypothetical protein
VLFAQPSFWLRPPERFLQIFETIHRKTELFFTLQMFMSFSCLPTFEKKDIYCILGKNIKISYVKGVLGVPVCLFTYGSQKCSLSMKCMSKRGIWIRTRDNVII